MSLKFRTDGNSKNFVRILFLISNRGLHVVKIHVTVKEFLIFGQ